MKGLFVAPTRRAQLTVNRAIATTSLESNRTLLPMKRFSPIRSRNHLPTGRQQTMAATQSQKWDLNALPTVKSVNETALPKSIGKKAVILPKSTK